MNHRRIAKKRCGTVALIIVSLLDGVANAQHRKPRRGYVPDERTAIRIAEAVAIPIYGEKEVKQHRPFHATLKNGVWLVAWSTAPGTTGGVISISINENTGAIVSVIDFP